MVMVCVDVRDPGNAGTMIRTADAAGVDAVVRCEGTVDPTNPKTVRSSAGSIFHVPVVVGRGRRRRSSPPSASWGLRTVGTAVRDGADYAAFDWRRRVALVFGNEASGLDETLATAARARVTIPMVGRAESLNVAVSARSCASRPCASVAPEAMRPDPGPARTSPHEECPAWLYDLGHAARPAAGSAESGIAP